MSFKKTFISVHVFEIAVDRQIGTHDQTFEGVSNPNRLWCVQPRPYLVHLGIGPEFNFNLNVE